LCSIGKVAEMRDSEYCVLQFDLGLAGFLSRPCHERRWEMMQQVQLIGFTLTLLAYGSMWFLVLKSKGIIEAINRRGMSGLRQIEEELNL